MKINFTYPKTLCFLNKSNDVDQYTLSSQSSNVYPMFQNQHGSLQYYAWFMMIFCLKLPLTKTSKHVTTQLTLDQHPCCTLTSLVDELVNDDRGMTACFDSPKTSSLGSELFSSF